MSLVEHICVICVMYRVKQCKQTNNRVSLQLNDQWLSNRLKCVCVYLRGFWGRCDKMSKLVINDSTHSKSATKQTKRRHSRKSVNKMERAKIWNASFKLLNRKKTFNDFQINQEHFQDSSCYSMNTICSFRLKHNQLNGCYFPIVFSE